MAEVSELDAIIGMNEFCLGITEDPQLQGWHRGNMATARQRRLEEVENIATHRFNETSYRIKAQTGTGKRIIELGNKHTQYDDGTRPGQKPMQARLKQNTSRTKRASVSSTGVSSQASRAASRTKSNAGSFVVAGSATSKTPYPPSGTTKEKPEERKRYRRVLNFFRPSKTS
jgi:hypothetical protein